MSIYVTGDTHGGFQRFTTKNFPQLKGMNRADLKRLGQAVSHITITGNQDVTVHFK